MTRQSENEANLLLLLHIQKLKGFQLQGDFAPLTSGSAPRPRWGLRLQTPVIGTRSALAMSVHPTYFDLATPLSLLDPHGTRVSQAASRSVQPFLQDSPACPPHKHAHTHGPRQARRQEMKWGGGVFTKSGKWGVFSVKSGPFLNDGCIM